MNPEKYLIDTSVWIKCLRSSDSSLHEYIAALILDGRAFTTEIIVMELLRGSKSDKEYAMLYQDFTALPQLDLSRDVWETAWGKAYYLRKKGINVPVADVLISVIAIYYKCTLLHDDRHYPLLAKHIGLKALEK